MTKTKLCPACKKEIPILAVRCSHCGFRVEGGRSKATRPIETLSRKDSGGASGEKGRTPKRTQVGMPLTTPASQAVVVSGAAPTSKPVSKTLPPVPVTGGAASATSRPPRPPAASPGEGGSSDGEEGDWIPEQTDPSGLIELPDGTDSTANLDISDLQPVESTGESAVDEGDIAVPSVSVADRIRTAGRVVWAVAAAPVISERAAQTVASRSEKLAAALRAVRWGYVAAAVVLLVVVVVAASGGGEAASPAAAARREPAPAAQPAAKPAKPSEKTAPAPASPEQQAAPTSSARCSAWTAYPSFPGSATLAAVLRYMGVDGVCRLFGARRTAVVHALVGRPVRLFPRLDGLPDGAAIEVVSQDRREPAIAFYFLNDTLWSVSLVFSGREAPSAKNWAKALDAAVAKVKNEAGIAVRRIVDGDVLIDIAPGRDGDRVSLMSQSMVRAHGDALTAYWKVEAAIRQGESALANRRFSDAAAAFEAALAIDAGAVRARLGRARAAAAMDDFAGAETHAQAVADATAAPDQRAAALDLMAQAALSRGDSKRAIALLDRAAVMAPASGLDAPLSWLRDGQYPEEHVALVAARMGCLDARRASAEGELARGYFPDATAFFKTLQHFEDSDRFARKKKQFERRECP